MSVTATFRTTAGIKSWEQSPQRIVDLSSMSTAYELEAEKNDAVEGSPLSNKRGMKKETVTFSSNYNAHLGINVKAEFESWKSWVGLAGILRFGTERFGVHSWLLTSVKATNINVDAAGRWRSAKIAFSFEESDDTSADAIEEAEAAIEAARSAAGVTATTVYKAEKKPKNTLLLMVQRSFTMSKYALGSIVNFKGGPFFATSTSAYSTTAASAGPARVIKTASMADHPFYITHTDGTTTVDGWVDVEQIGD